MLSLILFGWLSLAREVDMHCRVTGCAQELCMLKDVDIVASICVHRPQNVCFASADCVYDAARNNCGWSQTAALKTCLAEKAAKPTQ